MTHHQAFVTTFLVFKMTSAGKHTLQSRHHDSLPQMWTSSASEVIQVNLAYNDLHKASKTTDSETQKKKFCKCVYYQNINSFLTLLNKSATKHLKDWYLELRAYDHVNTKCSPRQCSGQCSMAMCQPASDRIKHGWPAAWLTDRKQAAEWHRARPCLLWRKVCSACYSDWGLWLRGLSRNSQMPPPLVFWLW